MEEGHPWGRGDAERRTRGVLRVSDVDRGGARCYHHASAALGVAVAGLAPSDGDFEARAAFSSAVAGLVPGQFGAQSPSATPRMNRVESSALSACMRIIPWRSVRTPIFSGSE
jgi:hypothetical protein